MTKRRISIIVAGVEVWELSQPRLSVGKWVLDASLPHRISNLRTTFVFRLSLPQRSTATFGCSFS